MKNVSVIIHFLNSERHLPQAIDSVIRQTHENWELVLVDGGSDDSSVEIAHRYKEQLPEKIKICAHQGDDTLGIFSSRIWGAQEAQYPILALLDSDDEWHPQFLQRHLEIYQHHFSERPGMVYCPVVYWWENPALAPRSYVQPLPATGLHECPGLVVEFIERGYEKSAANSGVMISRAILLETAELIGIAAEGIADDQFLWSHILLRHPVFASPEPLARYRQWEGSTCSKAIKQGEARDARKSHLIWLVKYLTAHYHGEAKSEISARVREILDNEFPGSEEHLQVSN